MLNLRAPSPLSKECQRLLDQCALGALDQQREFSAWAGEHRYEIDNDTGQLTLTPDGKEMVRFDFQDLGSESYGSGTWLWSWANESIPPAIQKSALEMRELGNEQSVSEFTTPELTVEAFGGDVAAILALGWLGIEAYYGLDYGQGKAWLLLTDDLPYEPATSKTLPSLASSFSEGVSLLPIRDHAQALAAYLAYWERPHEFDGQQRLVSDNEDGRLVASFDELGRCAEINAEV